MPAMQRILARNKRLFKKYNAFRKQMFAELAPKESETILYLLPWLLSVNDPKCPGYVADIKAVFRVFGVDADREIRRREAEFKRSFDLRRSGSLLRYAARYYFIEGLYTIGSVGTVSQTASSDCDIWICIDRQRFDRRGWEHLNRKVNLIKDWLDTQLKMPVYFFVSDVASIREGRFGRLDSESSGSTQKNVLKEEFYRSFILICGKIPLWWVCFDPGRTLDYDAARAILDSDEDVGCDLVDFGNLERIARGEYFGAALWQFHKSLTHPLKSIIKMILLKMLLEASEERLLCHELRQAVLSASPEAPAPDHSLFVMERVLEHMGGGDAETLQFLKECFYLRCEIDPYSRRQPLKNRLAAEFFKTNPLAKAVRDRLRRYANWDIADQIELGNRLFKFLVQRYREMAEIHSDAISDSDQRDLTILGRKISASYLPRENKVPVLHRPTAALNLSHLTLCLEKNRWQLYPGNNFKQSLAGACRRAGRDRLHGVERALCGKPGAHAAQRIEHHPAGGAQPRFAHPADLRYLRQPGRSLRRLPAARIDRPPVDRRGLRALALGEGGGHRFQGGLPERLGGDVRGALFRLSAFRPHSSSAPTGPRTPCRFISTCVATIPPTRRSSSRPSR